MAELRPHPFGLLVKRMLREFDTRESIFDLPRRKFFLGHQESDALDFSVKLHGSRVSSPLGPAAGPHTQMAQNMVLSWLAGCRVLELKTVQIMDELEIPRPCIDMETVGYNVEWSQELKLEQSLEEYVKGSMLIEILQSSGLLPVADGYRDVRFDMSVGYDLAGIQTDRVNAFLDGMQDATQIVDRLRSEIPEPFRQYRDLEFRSCISDTLTLSTFHGCPPDEIERIAEFLLEEKQIHTVIKLNPTLLGAKRCRELLSEQLGYRELHVPESAFEGDATWEQATGFADRLGTKAVQLGLGFGVKFSNTLIVENHRTFFSPEEKNMYLSGQPLHVLAMDLVSQFRTQFGDRFPISFSAGIDKTNFPDAVALGLVPITVCSDLLRPGGYARASAYLVELGKRMQSKHAVSIPEWILHAFGNAEKALHVLNLDADVQTKSEIALRDGGDLRVAAGERFDDWVSQALRLNTKQYAETTATDVRYHQTKNAKPPRKVGSELSLFDCLTCNKCIPVCPNHANFSFAIPPSEVPIIKLTRQKDGWQATQEGVVTIGKKVQYANFADFCNECGNCDVFCPEDGGPYVVKARFFGNHADWKAFANQNGFYVERTSIQGRIAGHECGLALSDPQDNQLRFSGVGFDLVFERSNLATPLHGSIDPDVEVDLTYLHILHWIYSGISDSNSITYLGEPR